MLFGMAHIRYGSFIANIPDDTVEDLRAQIVTSLMAGGVGTLNLTDKDGDGSTLYLTPGVPISVHDWDSQNG
jgi:hypothetical protein